MKVLFIAVFSDTSTNNAQSRGLQKAGCDVIEYNYRNRATNIGGPARDQEIIDTCRLEHPDFVLFSKCNGVHARVIQECNKYSKTVMWFMDPLHNFDNEVTEKIKHCTHTFCALTLPYYEAQKYSKKAHFLHEGFDSTVNYPVNIPYKHDVSFIGNLRGERGKYQKKYGFYNYTGAYGEWHSVAVAETKINLNFTEQNEGTSDRTYKVLASKGFLLTQPWERMEKDFVDGRDLVTFSNEDEFEYKIKYYLNNEEERKTIAENGYKTVQNFNRDNWAVRLLKAIYE
jgi:spore maturation protein CgeB